MTVSASSVQRRTLQSATCDGSFPRSHRRGGIDGSLSPLDVTGRLLVASKALGSARIGHRGPPCGRPRNVRDLARKSVLTWRYRNHWNGRTCERNRTSNHVPGRCRTVQNGRSRTENRKVGGSTPPLATG